MTDLDAPVWRNAVQASALLLILALGGGLGQWFGLRLQVPSALTAVLGVVAAAALLFGLRFRLGPRFSGAGTATLVSIALPLTISLLTFALLSRAHQDQNEIQFRRLIDDNRYALEARLSAYGQALDAGLGFFDVSQRITLREWIAFTQSARFQDNLPGINGVGYIAYVPPGGRPAFLDQVAADGVGNFTIKRDGPEDFIITYIVPVEPNIEAVGLNIAFEERRYEAATRAAETGAAAMTRKILLVQDDTHSPGFLILRAVYDPGLPTTTPEERRAALKGWIYAPLISFKFLSDLTPRQGESFHLSIFDGGDLSEDALIYTSHPADGMARKAAHREARTFQVMGATWTAVWESTTEFEAGAKSREAAMVLALGILISVLLGTLSLQHGQRDRAIRAQVARQTRDIQSRERENRAVIDTAAAAILLTDQNGHVISANRYAERLVPDQDGGPAGLPVDQVLDGLNLGDLRRLSEPSDGQQARKLELPLGDAVFDLSVTRWHDAEGHERFTIVGDDVTVQTRVSAELRETNTRWLMALEGSGLGVFDIDLDSGTSHVSDTWWHVMGLEPDRDRAPQSEFISRVHPDDLQTLRANDEACTSGLMPSSVTDIRVRNGADEWIWIRTQARVFKWGADGRAVRLIGTQQDVTKLKQAEFALRASHETFRAAHEGAPVGIALLDADGRFLKVNPALCALVAHTTDTLLAMTLADLIEGGDGAERLMRPWTDPGNPVRSHEIRLRRRDGREVWVRARISRVRSSSDGAQMVVSFEDINAARELDRIRNAFISSVSHELRTPLTSIRGGLGLVLGMAASSIPDQSRDLLSIALRNCERLILIVNDILDMEKLAAGRMDLRQEWMDPAEVTRIALTSNQGFAQEHDVTLKSDVLPEGYEILVDPGRFDQVLTNMMSNAAKFSPGGGVVRVGALVDGDELRIWVADDGPGIPKDMRDIIFDRFAQLDGPDGTKAKGTGLGLTIARRLMDEMGGRIWVDDSIGAGATFWVALPCRKKAARPSGAEEQPELVG